MPLMKKLYYDYQTFKEDTNKLLQKIPNDYQAIIAISRGGLTFAQALSEALDIRDLQTIQTQLYDKEKKREHITIVDNTSLSNNYAKVLIVDDIADSGETLKAVVDHLQNRYPSICFETITLFYKQTSIYKPTYWIKEAKEWIEFFWEVDFTL